MSVSNRIRLVAAALVGATCALTVSAQETPKEPPPEAYPTPFKEQGWAQLPQGRVWGVGSAIGVDRDGNIWVADHCGAILCSASKTETPPIVKLSPSGKFLKTFGAGLFVQPHGLYVDRDNHIWVTDVQGKDSGNFVVEFDQNGKVLMTLGKDVLDQPTGLAMSPSGRHIFVSDGHDSKHQGRVFKFNRDGSLVKRWGTKGSGPGQLNQAHSIAVDSQGRVFVADRGNGRLEIYDSDGNFLDEWKQFGRATGVFIDGNDTLYVSDTGSTPKTNPGFKRGIFIGSAKDGVVKSFIRGIGADPDGVGLMVGEGVAADRDGNVYWVETTAGQTVRKFVRH
jgi:sugar lactone lactonase YvrE